MKRVALFLLVVAIGMMAADGSKPIPLSPLDLSNLVEVLSHRCNLLICILEFGCLSAQCQGEYSKTLVIAEDTQENCYHWAYKYQCKGVLLRADGICELTTPCEMVPHIGHEPNPAIQPKPW